jgi:hypothetical protein
MAEQDTWVDAIGGWRRPWATAAASRWRPVSTRLAIGDGNGSSCFVLGTVSSQLALVCEIGRGHEQESCRLHAPFRVVIELLLRKTKTTVWDIPSHFLRTVDAWQVAGFWSLQQAI